jgi:hypothetical protein
MEKENRKGALAKAPLFPQIELGGRRMTREEKLRRFAAWEEKLGAYEYAMRLIGVDNQAQPPTLGAPLRNERAAILSGEALKLRQDEEMYDIVREMQQWKDLDPVLRRRAELHEEAMRNSRCVPPEEYMAYQRTLSESGQAWLRCKKENDFAAYAPYLARLVEAHKQAAAWYVEQLASPEAMTARQFLAERGFDQEEAFTFVAALEVCCAVNALDHGTVGDHEGKAARGVEQGVGTGDGVVHVTHLEVEVEVTVERVYPTLQEQGLAAPCEAVAGIEVGVGGDGEGVAAVRQG